MSKVFFEPIPHWRTQNETLLAFGRAYRSHFESDVTFEKYFRYLITPKSGHWFFKPNGKTGTTSALSFLFYLEFGSQLNAELLDQGDLNSSPVPHRLVSHNVFRLLHQRSDLCDPLEYFRKKKYIVTVRNPLERAQSAFRYICKSQKLRHQQFAGDRSRMCALVAFDWDRHIDTIDGFERFLEYVKICLEFCDQAPLDPHWAPQWLNIRPDVRTPDIVGKTEDMAAFFEEVFFKLDLSGMGRRPLAPLNNTSEIDTSESVATAAIRQLILACYEKDYSYFNYDL